MLLIEAGAVPTPADAERLLADLWQLTAGRGIGLFTFGLGERVLLGVACAHAGIEETAASTIANQCGGIVEGGSMVVEIARCAPQTAAVNFIPTDRRLHLESRTFGWQRSDPLRATFLALVETPADALTGVALSLRALPGLAFAVSVGAFAAGTDAASHVARLSVTFGGVGVRLRRPMLQRHAARRMLRGALRRPASVHRVEVVAHFWHPPYASDLALVGERDGGPAGYLAAHRNP